MTRASAVNRSATSDPRKKDTSQVIFSTWDLVLDWCTRSDMTDMSLTSFALVNSNLEHKVSIAGLFQLKLWKQHLSSFLKLIENAKPLFNNQV